jgi:hypothetical protein
MFWVPQSGDIGIGVSILSYIDKVQFSLITDRHFVPDPETIAPLFAAEFEKMVLALLMIEWETPVDPDQVEQQLFGKPEAPASSAVKAQRAAPAARHPRAKAQAGPASKAAATAHPAKAVATKAETPAPAPAARVPKRFRGL